MGEVNVSGPRCKKAFIADTIATAGAPPFCQQFFGYYNHEHRHIGSGLHTPASGHSAPSARSKPSAPTSWPPRTPATHTDSDDHHSRPDCPTVWINRPTLEPALQNN